MAPIAGKTPTSQIKKDPLVPRDRSFLIVLLSVTWMILCCAAMVEPLWGVASTAPPTAGLFWIHSRVLEDGWTYVDPTGDHTSGDVTGATKGPPPPVKQLTQSSSHPFDDGWSYTDTQNGIVPSGDGASNITALPQPLHESNGDGASIWTTTKSEGTPLGTKNPETAGTSTLDITSASDGWTYVTAPMNSNNNAGSSFVSGVPQGSVTGDQRNDDWTFTTTTTTTTTTSSLATSQTPQENLSSVASQWNPIQNTKPNNDDDEWNYVDSQGGEKSEHTQTLPIIPPMSSTNGVGDQDGDWHYVDQNLSKEKPRLHHNHHEKSLYPLSKLDIWGFILAGLGLMLAAGGGVGGGGFLVPIYCLVMGMSPKHAIPLSNITVLGGAVSNTVLNWPKRHPQADRPLIDWDLILVMEPLTIAGALAGAILNKVLPELLLTVLLVVLLSFTAYTTLTKAISLYKKESQALRTESELTKLAREQAKFNEETAEGIPLRGDGEDEEAPEETYDDIERLKCIQKMHENERQPPKENIRVLLVMFVVVLIANVLKGGGAFHSPLGITCGSFSFWLANLLILGYILTVAGQARVILMGKNKAKLDCGYPYQENDIRWDSRATIIYPILCGSAGFFAGMFGIGGGIVKGPLMLAMGVHPAVSSASSACMILFTSFTASTSFWVFGLLRMDYAVPCFVLGIAATFIGQIGLNIIIRRAGGRNSYIAFVIGAVVLISAVLMTVQSLLSFASGEKHHAGGVCGRAD